MSCDPTDQPAPRRRPLRERGPSRSARIWCECAGASPSPLLAAGLPRCRSCGGMLTPRGEEPAAPAGPPAWGDVLREPGASAPRADAVSWKDGEGRPVIRGRINRHGEIDRDGQAEEEEGGPSAVREHADQAGGLGLIAFFFPLVGLFVMPLAILEAVAAIRAMRRAPVNARTRLLVVFASALAFLSPLTNLAAAGVILYWVLFLR